MYVDTSVLVKLFIREEDSDKCEAAVGRSTLVSSYLLRCEFRSAILRHVARGTVTESQKEEVWQKFESNVADKSIVLVPLDDLVVKEATTILDMTYPQVHLRTLDALHLATFVSLDAGPLLTTDLRMRQAARSLGLNLAF
jgi:predicted nucleic acid-binding protein